MHNALYFQREKHLYAALRIGAIACWALAIASEYAIQTWRRREKLLNILAGCFFALALLGEVATYRLDAIRDSRLQAEVASQGIPVTQWFHARKGDTETFDLSDDPLIGSVAVLINGLIEPDSIYIVSGRSVTLSTPLSDSDQVIIEYRRARR